MKKLLILSALTTVTASAQVWESLSLSGGTLSDGTTYGVVTSGFGVTDHGVGDFELIGNATNVTITFSNAVDFQLGSTAVRHRANFETVTPGFTLNSATTLTADAGVWDTSNAVSGITFTTGSSITGDTGGNLSNGDSNAWGYATIDGVTSISVTAQDWSPDFSPQTLSGEAFNFSASSVPEPSSSCLLGLGALSLLVRRKR